MKNKIKFLLGFILFFSLILSFVASLKQELWVDEAYCIHSVKNFQFPYYDITSPPIYFLILKMWAFFSLKVIWLRSLSIIFSIFSLFFYFKLSKLLLNRKFALLSTFLLSISPFYLHYSWQIRTYSLFFLLVIISLYCSVIFIINFKAKEELSQKFLGLFFLVNLLGSLAHFGFLLYLVSLGLFFLSFLSNEKNFLILKKQVRLFIFFLAHLLIPILTFLFLNDHSGDILNNIGWISQLDVKKIFLSFNNIFVSSHFSNYFLPVFVLVNFYGLVKMKKVNSSYFFLCLIGISFPIILVWFFQKIFTSSIALPRSMLSIYILIQLTTSFTVYDTMLAKKNKSIFLKTIILILIILLTYSNLSSNLSINFKSFYVSDDYLQGVNLLKTRVKNDDKIIILPTYFSKLFWYHWGQLNVTDKALFPTTINLERNLHSEASIFLETLETDQDLFFIINYKSILSKNEYALIEDLHAYCDSNKIDFDTEIIFCPKLVLKSFLPTSSKKTPELIPNNVP